jgi:hypothetical protein
MGIVLPPERQPEEDEVDWLYRLRAYHPASMPDDGWKKILHHDTVLLTESPWVPERVRARLRAELRGEPLPPPQPPNASRVGR